MTTEIVASTAWELNEKIMECNYHVRANFLKMAELLCRMRDEKLYIVLDCKTFEEYLATLAPEGTRAWMYKLMRCYEVFAKKLDVPAQTLIAIGPSKLDILAPMVPAIALDDQHRAEWLDKAANLSKSDLINEVRQSQGKQILSSLPSSGVTPETIPGLSDLLKYASYMEYVKDSPCMVCQAVPVDAHHFPVTRGHGGKEVEEWVVPLCRQCHSEFHSNPIKFTHDYGMKWGAYYYGIILRVWEK